MDFEEGFGALIWIILNSLMVKFAKEIILEDKEKEKEILNGQTEEYIRES